jgi:putative salt-induced outer membrane protein YdiY
MNLSLPSRARPLAAALAFAAAVSLSAAAQEAEEPELGWAATAELSLVAAAGNTETSSLGLRATATRTWEEMLLKLEAGALRVEQTERTHRAVGPPDAVVLVEEEDSVLTADNQFLRGRLDREIGERLLAFAGAGWERDELAGIADRLSVATGLGHVWAEREDFVSRTTYGVTYTWEESTAGREDDFAGLRAGWDLLRRLTPTTVFTNALVVDQNLEETSDLRVEELASVAVTISDRLALKVSAHLKLDADPALLEVPREEPEGTPTGDVVLVELDELDTVLSAALVVSF